MINYNKSKTLLDGGMMDERHFTIGILATLGRGKLYNKGGHIMSIYAMWMQ